MPVVVSAPTCARLMAASWVVPNLATSEPSMPPTCVVENAFTCVAVSAP